MWKWKRLAFFVVILLLLVAPTLVSADSTETITITAVGYIVGAPGGLTLTYISDYEIGISWTKGPGAVNTLVRAAYDRLPTDRSDGFEIYYGSGTSATQWIENLGLVGPIYYRAWSETANGTWEETGTTGVGNFMSQSFLFIGVIIMAGFLTFLARYTGQLLMRIAAALIWLVLGIWLLIGNVTNLGLDSPWTQVLGFVFIIMVIVPLTWQMRTEVRTESQGKLWSEWSKIPREPVKSRSQLTKERHKERLRTIRERRRLQ